MCRLLEIMKSRFLFKSDIQIITYMQINLRCTHMIDMDANTHAVILT